MAYVYVLLTHHYCDVVLSPFQQWISSVPGDVFPGPTFEHQFVNPIAFDLFDEM